MSDLAQLLERNTDRPHPGELTLRPAFSAIVISCLDARTDPAHFLGLEPGDALVVRNAGGRVTDEVEQQLLLLAAMAQRVGAFPFEVAVVHHTDCGMERLADPQLRSGLSQATGLALQTLEGLAIHDHDATLRVDVDRLAVVLPPAIGIVGLRYDTKTGEIVRVVEAKR